MNKFYSLFMTVLIPLCAHLNAQAAPSYSYDCESDANGIEALCIAVPSDMTAEEEKPAAATKSTAEATKGKDTNLVFGAIDANNSQANAVRPGVSPQVQNSASGLNAMRTQEKIRQVENFLRSTDVRPGTAADGPMAAGND